jgi:hypothetical protein
MTQAAAFDPQQPRRSAAGRLRRRLASHNLVAIARLAEALDEGSLQLALRIVPGEWWTARLAASSRDLPGRARNAHPSAPGSPGCSSARPLPNVHHPSPLDDPTPPCKTGRINPRASCRPKTRASLGDHARVRISGGRRRLCESTRRAARLRRSICLACATRCALEGREPAARDAIAWL